MSGYRRLGLSLLVSAMVLTPSHAFLGGGALSAAAIQKAMENAIQKKMSNILKETVGAKLNIGTTTSATANISIQKQKIAGMIQDKLGNTQLSKTAADMVEGCFSSIFKQLGVRLKLPNVNICGVNLTNRLFNALTKNYQKHFSLWDVVENKTPIQRSPSVRLTEADIKSFEKKVGSAIVGGSRNYKKENLESGTEDLGEPKNSRKKKIGSYAVMGGSASVVKLSSASSGGGTPSYFEGVEYTPDVQNYVNETLNRAYAREMVNEADKKKEELEILAVCDMTNGEVVEDVKKNGKNSAAASIALPFPAVAQYESDFQGKKLLSARPDNKIFTTSMETISLYDFLKADKGGKLISSFESAYKKATGKTFKFIKGRVDYGKLSEMALKATAASLSSIKMDGSEGKFLARMEMLKGILHQLVVLNHQMANENYMRMRILFRENEYLRKRLDEIQNTVDMISGQISKYGRENLKILRNKK